MPKGAIAKESVANIIKNAFGSNYIGEFDRKHYVWANDGAEKVQISIALTCPKIYRGIEESSPAALNFDDEDFPAAKGHESFKPADITPEETETLTKLMEKLGL